MNINQRSRVAVWLLFGIAGGLLFSMTVSAVAEDGNATLRVGVAEVEITPPEKYPISGYYHERLATGTIDPLKARALVFAAGDERAAVVCCDLTGIATDLATEVRRRVASKAGIPANQIMLTASHSHTAPDYFKDLYLYLNTPEAQRGLGRLY